ncbi:hypothetical protein [Kaistella palustris]|uniref:hypothetical protein n=1 Tax=Kaistella palustris TaxID=493376 RepID=UPI00041EA445|nr:hypothetical protein [Kaistella palustris]
MYLKIFSLSLMIISCNPAVKGSSDSAKNEIVQNKALDILSATESSWIGGVAGVRGKIYTVRIKRSASQDFTFTSLKTADGVIPVNVTLKNNIYTVTARTSPSNPQISAGAAPGSFPGSGNTNKAVLYYLEGTSKNPKQLIISEFTKIGTDLKDGDELIP